MIKLFKNGPNKKYNQIISRGLFDYKDPFYLEKQLSDDENSIRNMAHSFSKKYLLPNVVQSFRNEKFDKNIMKEMGALGFLGPLLTDMVVRVLIMFRMV